MKFETLCKQVLAESKPSAGLTKKEKSSAVKKAKAGKDFGKKGKNLKKNTAQKKLPKKSRVQHFGKT